MICASIREGKMENVLRKLKMLPPGYDLVEIWVNEIGDFNPEELFSEKGRKKIIVKFSENTQELAKKCIKTGFEIFDFDESAVNKELFELKGSDQKIIISYHDFEKTPLYSDAVEIVRSIKAKGADIAKVVFTAGKISDNLIPLKLLSEKEILGLPVISFCMGELGKMSRIYAPKFGCEINFVAPDESWITAEGQFTKDNWDRIQNLLK